MENLFYPKRKAMAKVKLPDEVFAVLNPIAYKLNRGVAIVRGSDEHKLVLELLSRAE